MSWFLLLPVSDSTCEATSSLCNLLDLDSENCIVYDIMCYGSIDNQFPIGAVSNWIYMKYIVSSSIRNIRTINEAFIILSFFGENVIPKRDIWLCQWSYRYIWMTCQIKLILVYIMQTQKSKLILHIKTITKEKRIIRV